MGGMKKSAPQPAAPAPAPKGVRKIRGTGGGSNPFDGLPRDNTLLGGGVRVAEELARRQGKLGPAR
jgi:hypothetical protein